MTKSFIRRLLLAGVIITAVNANSVNAQENTGFMEEQLNLTQEWDKVFPQSDKVTHSKITFHNRYGVTLAADLYIPKNTDGSKLPAIAVSGPFGAVKEQASGLYAQTLAERGFLTIAFDPSFTGESGGQPRYVASPISAQQWTTCPPVRMWIRSASASWASAAGADWRSMQRP